MSTSIHINLALAFDEGYIKPFYVLLTSLFSNNKAATISLHLIATGISLAEEQTIQRFVESYGGEVIFYEVPEKGINQFVLPDHKENYLSVAIYYRLFFPFLVPEAVKKLLYIDVDTLVVGSLVEAFTISMQGCAAAAVTDTDMPVRSDLGIARVEDYFNSGVLIIDIDEWKKQRITEKALEVIRTEPQKIKRYPDQDALNIVLKDKWYRLPSRFNLMRLYVPDEVPKRAFSAFLAQQLIIHYNGKKPWFSDCEHRLRDEYFRYLRLSPMAGNTELKPVKVRLTGKKRNMLLRSRLIEFYFDHPELVAVWRKLKSLVK